MASCCSRGSAGVLDPVGWQELAPHKDAGRATFFGPSLDGAKARCGRCRAQEICLWCALATEEEGEAGWRFGLSGATAPALRHQIAVVIRPGCIRRRLELLLEAHSHALAKGA